MSAIQHRYVPGNNTIILFATQFKNGIAAFHWSSALSGGLRLLRAFCQWWKIENQVRKCRLCVKGLILRNMAGREKDAGRLYESSYRQ